LKRNKPAFESAEEARQHLEIPSLPGQDGVIKYSIIKMIT